MKLQCTCGNFITKDLYPTKGWKTTPKYPDEEDIEYVDWDYSVHKGSFLRFTVNYRRESVFAVNPLDLINCRVPEFQAGWGCCDNWGIPFYCGSCDKEVGYQQLDCFCEKHMQIVGSKVKRWYKK